MTSIFSYLPFCYSCLFCTVNPDDIANPSRFSQIGLEMQQGILWITDFIFFFWWKSHIPLFVSMMVNFCYHNVFQALFHFRTPLSLFPHCDCSTDSVRSLTNTNENCSSSCGHSLKRTSAARFRSGALSWTFHLRGENKRECRPQHQRAAPKSKPFRAWSLQTRTFAAVKVFWHLCSPECRMNQLWHCTMFIVFHPYFPKCGDVWTHLKRECQQADGRFPS